MASDNEASCVCDPNFAVICSFLERFGKSCGITYPDFAELQEMIENTQEVAPMLIDLHIKLLRKARKSVNIERWERTLVKFCHTYSNQDGWEIERFGYKKARVSVKLQALKNLLEEQFDSNQKFKTEVNRLAASELRLEPLGRDRKGYAYWCQMDDWCNLRIYREDLDEETWKLVAKNREGLINLISELSSNETATGMIEAVLNDDSNSLGIEKPIIDTGQEENKDIRNLENVKKINEIIVSQDNNEDSSKKDEVLEECKLVNDDKISKVIIKVKTDMFEISKPTVSLKRDYNDSKSEIEVKRENKIETCTKSTNEDNYELLHETEDSTDIPESNIQKSEDSLTKQIEKSENSSDKSTNISDESENISEKFENISKKSVNITEKSENITENSENISEKCENISEKCENISEKSENISEKCENISEQSENILKKSENISEKSEKNSGKSEAAIKRSEDILEKPEDTLEENQDMLEKPEETLKSSENTSEKYESVIKKPESISEKFGNISTKSENSLKKNESTLLKSEVPKKSEPESMIMEENKLTKTLTPFKISVRKDLIISPPKGLDSSDTDEIEEKPKISNKMLSALTKNDADIAVKSSPKIPETNITIEPVKKSIRIKTVPKKVIEISSSKPLDQSVLKQLSSETSLDPAILKKLSNLEDIKINPTMVKTNLSISKCDKDREDNRKQIPGANISISAANISITPPSLNTMKKILNIENPFSPVSRYKGTQENIRGLEDLIDNIYSNVGVDLSNKSASFSTAVQETDGLDLSKKSQRNDIQMHEIDLSTKKSRDETLNNSAVAFHGLPINLEKTVSLKRGLNTLDDEYVIRTKKKKPDEYSSNESSSDEEVGEEIEEPVMLVQGEGSGKECEGIHANENTCENSYSDIFWCSDVIEEPLMLFYGSGLGHDCNTGNTGKEEESKTNEGHSKDLNETDVIQNIHSSSSNDNDSIDNNRDKTELAKSSCKESESTIDISKNKSSDVEDENISTSKLVEIDSIKGPLKQSEHISKLDFTEKTSANLPEKITSVSEKSLAPLPATKRFLQSVSVDSEETFKNPAARSVTITSESEKEEKKSEIDSCTINSKIDTISKSSCTKVSEYNAASTETEKSNKSEDEVLNYISGDSEKQSTKLSEKISNLKAECSQEGSSDIPKELLLSSTSSSTSECSKSNVLTTEENVKEDTLISHPDKEQKDVSTESIPTENVLTSPVKNTEGIKKTTFFFGPGSLFNKPESKKTETTLISKREIFETKNDDTKAIIDEIDATIDFMKSDFPQHGSDKHTKNAKCVEDIKKDESSETDIETDLTADTLLKDDNMTPSSKSDNLSVEQKVIKSDELFCVEKSEVNIDCKNEDINTTKTTDVLKSTEKSADIKPEDISKNKEEMNVINDECVKQVHAKQESIENLKVEQESADIDEHKLETRKIHDLSLHEEKMSNDEFEEVNENNSTVKFENVTQEINSKENSQQLVCETQNKKSIENSVGDSTEKKNEVNTDKKMIADVVHIEKTNLTQSSEENITESKGLCEKSNTVTEKNTIDSSLEIKRPENCKKNDQVEGNNEKVKVTCEENDDESKVISKEDDENLKVKSEDDSSFEQKESERVCKKSDESNENIANILDHNADNSEHDTERLHKQEKGQNKIEQDIVETDIENSKVEGFTTDENKVLDKHEGSEEKINVKTSTNLSEIHQIDRKSSMDKSTIETLTISKNIIQENPEESEILEPALESSEKDVIRSEEKIVATEEKVVATEKKVEATEEKLVAAEEQIVTAEELKNESEIINKNATIQMEKHVVKDSFCENISIHELECAQPEQVKQGDKTKNEEAKHRDDIKSRIVTDVDSSEKVDNKNNFKEVENENDKIDPENSAVSVDNDNIDDVIVQIEVNKIEDDNEIHEDVMDKNPDKLMIEDEKTEKIAFDESKSNVETIIKENVDVTVIEVDNAGGINNKGKLIAEISSENKKELDTDVAKIDNLKMAVDEELEVKKADEDKNEIKKDSEKLRYIEKMESADGEKNVGNVSPESSVSKDSEQNFDKVCTEDDANLKETLNIQEDNDVNEKKYLLDPEKSKIKDNLNDKTNIDSDFGLNVEMVSLKTKEMCKMDLMEISKEPCVVNNVLRDDDLKVKDLNNEGNNFGQEKKENLSCDLIEIDVEKKIMQKNIEDSDVDGTREVTLKSVENVSELVETASTSKVTDNLLKDDSKSITLPPKKHFLESENTSHAAASDSDSLDDLTVMPKKKFKLDLSLKQKTDVQKISSETTLDTSEREVMTDLNGDDKKVPKLKLDNVPTENSVTKIETAISNDVVTLSEVECDAAVENKCSVDVKDCDEMNLTEVLEENQLKEKPKSDVINIPLKSKSEEIMSNASDEKINSLDSSESPVCSSKGKCEVDLDENTQEKKSTIHSEIHCSTAKVAELDKTAAFEDTLDQLTEEKIFLKEKKKKISNKDVKDLEIKEDTKNEVPKDVSPKIITDDNLETDTMSKSDILTDGGNKLDKEVSLNKEKILANTKDFKDNTEEKNSTLKGDILKVKETEIISNDQKSEEVLTVSKVNVLDKENSAIISFETTKGFDSVDVEKNQLIQDKLKKSNEHEQCLEAEKDLKNEGVESVSSDILKQSEDLGVVKIEKSSETDTVLETSNDIENNSKTKEEMSSVDKPKLSSSEKPLSSEKGVTEFTESASVVKPIEISNVISLSKDVKSEKAVLKINTEVEVNEKNDLNSSELENIVEKEIAPEIHSVSEPNVDAGIKKVLRSSKVLEITKLKNTKHVVEKSLKNKELSVASSTTVDNKKGVKVKKDLGLKKTLNVNASAKSAEINKFEEFKKGGEDQKESILDKIETKRISESEQVSEEEIPFKKIKSKSKGKVSKKSKAQRKRKTNASKMKKELNIQEEQMNEEIDRKKESDVELKSSEAPKRPLLMCVDINKLRAIPEKSSKSDSKVFKEVKSAGGRAVSSRASTRSDDSIIGIDTDSMELGPVEDPLACTDDLTVVQKETATTKKIVSAPVVNITDLKFDMVERTTRSRAQKSNVTLTVPPVSIRRKRSHETPENIEETEETGGGKRRRTRNKRSVDVNLRRSIEQQKQMEVSSSDEENLETDNNSALATKKKATVPKVSIILKEPVKPSSPAVAKAAPSAQRTGRTLRSSSSNTTVAPVVVIPPKVKKEKSPPPQPAKVSKPPVKSPKGEPRKRKNRLLGLDIDANLILPNTMNAKQELEAPVRQSRRIAQIKIKEEAERRKIEEFTLAEMKSEQKKKKKTSDYDKNFKLDHRKRKGKPPVDDESTNDSVEKKKKKKKKKRREGLKFDELNPWKSSSGSSSSNEEEEDEVEEAEEMSEEEVLFKSDHEFSPESDLEENTEIQPLRRARTAKVESDAEEADEHACQQCGKSDHPEWILLCDSCDCGWHCSCLRPALLVIPEGDWFCPPCQHITLVARLKLQLQEFDKLESQMQQKQRNEFTRISAANILSGKDYEEQQRDEFDRSESGTEDSESSGSGGSSSDSEPIYQLRQRRQVNSYLFSEYDNLIKSAIQDEMEAVKGSAGNQGRGKDISTIVNAEKEENENQTLETKDHENVETPQIPISDKGDTVLGDSLEDEQDHSKLQEDALVAPHESSEDEIPPVVVRRKHFFKKKHANLTNLDITSEEDNRDSDEDFKGSSSEDDEEDYDDAGSDDSDDFNYSRGRRKGSLRKNDGPLRRSTRARTTRYDRDFINDDSDDAPRKKKSRSIWDESESEDSDKSWGRRRSKPKRHSFPSFRRHRKSKSKSKKKRRMDVDPDPENPRPVKVKKPRIKYGGLDEIEDDENESPMRRTRGRKINYLEALGTDSEEEALKSTVKPLPESEDEYVVNEEEEEDEDVDKFETKSELEHVLECDKNPNEEIMNKSDLLEDLLEFKADQEVKEHKELGPNPDSQLNLSSDLNLVSEPKVDSEFKLGCGTALDTKSNLDSEEKLSLEQKLDSEPKSEFEHQLGFGLNLDSEPKLESVLRSRLEDSEGKLESVNKIELISDETRREINSSLITGEEMFQSFSPITMSNSLVNLKTIRRPQKSRSPRGSRVPRGFGSLRQPRNPSVRGRGRGSRGGRRGLMSRPPSMFNVMEMKPEEKNNEEILNTDKSEIEHLDEEEEELEEGEIPKSVLREMSHLDSELEEDMDEEEIAELMMEEEEFANKQLERAAAQIARDKKRKEREAKREEKLKKRQERLEKKLQKEKEKEQKEILRKQKEEERQRLREQLGEHAVKEPKKRGRKKKSEIEAAAAAMALASGVPISSMSGITTEMMMASSSETIASAMSGENSIAASTDSFDPDISASTSGENKPETPMLPKLVVRTNLFNPPTESFMQSSNHSVITGMGMGMGMGIGMSMGMGMDMSHSPPKRRGRGKGKKTLAAEAAAAAAAEAASRGDTVVSTGVVPAPVQSPLGGHLPPGTPMQTSPMGMLSQGSPLPKASTPTDMPIQGGKLGIVAPPQPFTQTQPTPSVITRMLQSQPMSGSLGSSNFSASIAHKYFSGVQNSTGNSSISSAGPPVSLPGGSASAGPPPSVSPGLPPVTDSPSMRGPPPGPFPVLGPRGRIPSPYRQGPHNIPSPHYTPGSTPPPHVRLPVSSANVAQIFHTGHHPLDPSPSGGGPIAISNQSRERNSPAFVPPSASSPLTNKGTPPPPPYSRPSPIGRFSAADVPPPVTSGTSITACASPSVGPTVAIPTPSSVGPTVAIGPSGSQPNALTSAPVRHHIPFSQQGMQQPSPSPPRLPGNFNSYHSQPPPSYHYGTYPPPPSMAAAEDALPPPAYQGSPYPDHYMPQESQQMSQPLSDSSNSKPFEEDSGGEFGGLVSYFSSQREDDLDS